MKNNNDSLKNRIKGALYDFKLWLYDKFGGNKKAKEINLKASAKRESVFLFTFLLIPLTLFVVFYFGVNFNSFLLAFQKLDGGKKSVTLDNFKQVLSDVFVEKTLKTAIKNSLIQSALYLFFATPLQIAVSYSLFKKIPFHGFFKIMLFLPTMVSSMVFVMCARALIVNGFPQIVNDPTLNLLDPYKGKSFWTVLIFGLWMDFAGQMIITLGAMARVSPDVLEYAKLENLSSLQELWYIVLPSIFPTIVTFITIQLASFFTSYGYLYSFFGDGASLNQPYETLGLVFFLKVARAASTANDQSYAAAGGLLFTAVLAPVTICVKTLLEKYGPSEE